MGDLYGREAFLRAEGKRHPLRGRASSQMIRHLVRLGMQEKEKEYRDV